MNIFTKCALLYPWGLCALCGAGRRWRPLPQAEAPTEATAETLTVLMYIKTVFYAKKEKEVCSNMNLKIPKVKQSAPLLELTAFLNLRKSGFNFINQRNRNI